jgi:catechol 2,3-dioxygenase-like lactoylglutathione lyase family enzyme
MHRLGRAIAITLVIVACASRAGAQLVAGPEPIIYGHHHLNVTSLEMHKKFWVDTLGGTLVKLPNDVEIVKFAGVLVFMRAQAPTGGTKGTTVNHVGFTVTNLRQVLDKVKANGFRIVTKAEAAPTVTIVDDIVQISGGAVSGGAYVMAPDDVKVELLEIKNQAAPVMLHHVHFFQPQNKEMQAWYVKIFGAKPRTGAFLAADLPGVVLNFSESPDPVVGTKGRALDHIGFEVRHLEEFCKKLEAQGITFDVPYRKVPALNVAIAFITDPWGTSIELTEGLDKIS